MKFTKLILPSIALGAAGVLLTPAETQGFTTLGFNLSTAQRDFRVFNNFQDAAANNNNTPDSNFNGYFGAVMAIWKGCIEWQSNLHGNGNGDPHQNGGLGSGGANFDPSFQGEATAVGGINDNVHSSLGSSCGGGTLAFTESPSSNGWRIRYCEEWVWADGPGTSIGGSQIDLQGVACHEYGHALGLGHTSVNGSTMTAFINGNGVTDRSIGSDDIAGVQNIYGAASGTKPRITGVSVNGNQVTITGTNFTTTNNEVWFTQANAGGTGTPVKVIGASSSGGGTQITVTIPGTAGDGDIQVKRNSTGNSSLSNAWPFDPGSGGGGGGAPTISNVNPSLFSAVVPDLGTGTLTGTNFTTVTSVTVGGVPLTPNVEFQIVNATTLTFTVLPVTFLGPVNVVVTNPSGSAQTSVAVVANTTPTIDLDSSVPNVLLNQFGVTVRMGDVPGRFMYLAVALDPGDSILPGVYSFNIGNNFTSLFGLGLFVPDAGDGYAKLTVPMTTLPSLTNLYFQAASTDISGTLPMVMSNVQQGTILF